MTGLSGIGILALIVFFVTKVLTLGFCLHLAFRAYWLALVCVNYAYPKGINFEKVRFKKPFDSFILRNRNLKDKIIQIDRYAGLIMFGSILSVFIFIGIFVEVVVLILFVLLLDSTGLFEVTVIGSIIKYSLLLPVIVYILYVLDLLLLNIVFLNEL